MKNFYFILSSFTFLLVSCGNNTGCKLISISKEDKEWFNHLQVADSLLYQSNKGNIDRFVVKEINSSYTQCNKFELGENQYESYELIIKPISSKKDITSNNKSIWVKFFKDVTNQFDKSSQKNFAVFDFESDWFVDFSNLKMDSITLNTNKKRYNVYFFDRSSKYNEDGSKAYVKSFYWSKKHGLLRYELFTGEIFELSYL